MIEAVLAVAISFQANVLVEPATSEPLPEAIEAGGLELEITGADVRRVMGMNAYALGHYVCDSSAVPEDPAAALDYLCEAPLAKALVFRGTHAIPARGIRWSWRKSLSRVDYEGEYRSSFVDAFSGDFEVGTVLCLYTDGKGGLKAVQDGKVLGEWNEPALVAAVWNVALGEDAEVVTRENLVARDRLEPCTACPADTAARYAAALQGLDAD
ncbi:MAG: hypothetical protein GC168_11170 [Candidatus Hydrogenedens sp.]|nr:hypothetical protein [Candidatus Hydrogenedens sp.]